MTKKKPKVYGPKEFADRARGYIVKFKNEVSWDGSPMEDTYVIDFLTDLRHFCKEEKIDFAKCLRISRYHHEEEEDECTSTSPSRTSTRPS